MREAWLLWRLVRLLRANRASGASACIQLVQERETSASYREALDLAMLQGEPPPKPRQGFEVTIWLDTASAAKVHRGANMGDALVRALNHCT